MTQAQYAATLSITLRLSEAIRTAGEIPAGTLYAACMEYLTLAQFEALLAILINTGMVRRQTHLLTWIGPTLERGIEC